MQKKVGGRLLIQTWVGPSGKWQTLSTQHYMGTFLESGRIKQLKERAGLYLFACCAQDTVDLLPDCPYEKPLLCCAIYC